MTHWPDPNAPRAATDLFVHTREVDLAAQKAAAKAAKRPPPPEGWATLSPCGHYRHVLGRKLSDTGPRGLLGLLNSSSADGRKNDPTVTNVITRARNWGWGQFEIVNLFPWRSPHPDDLLTAGDPIGSDADRQILEAIARSDVRVVAWGSWLGDLRASKKRREKVSEAVLHRDEAVLKMFRAAGEVFAIGENLANDGSRAPTHPLARGTSWMPVERALKPFKGLR